MKRWTILVASFALILGFQNCSKVNSPLDGSAEFSDSVAPGGIGPDGQANSKVEYDQISTDAFDRFTAWDNDKGKFYDINLGNGDVTEFVYERDGEVPGDKFCLNDQDKQNLSAILAQAKICVPKTIVTESGTVCSMIYRYPYATFENALGKHSLGEVHNGCDRPSDLCGDKADQLKLFVKNLVLGMSSRKCN